MTDNARKTTSTTGSTPGKRRSDSFVMIPRDVLARSDLTPIAKLAYGLLSNEIAQGNSYRGMRWIAVRLGVSSSAVARSIEALEQLGLLEVERDIREPTTKRVDRKPGGRGGPRRRSKYALPENKGTIETKGKRYQDGTLQEENQNDKALSKRDAALSKRDGSVPLAGHGIEKTDSKNVDELAAYFAEKRNARYRGRYRPKPTDATDFAAMLEDADGDVREVKARIDGYFASDDPYYTKKRHPVRLLLRQFDRFASEITDTGDNDAELTEHPVIADAHQRWPDDVIEHTGEWAEIAKVVERDGLDAGMVHKSRAVTGEQFRAEFRKLEAARHAG